MIADFQSGPLRTFFFFACGAKRKNEHLLSSGDHVDYFRPGLSNMIATKHMNLLIFAFKLFNNECNKSSIALVIFQVLNKAPMASGHHIRRCRFKIFPQPRKFYGQKPLLKNIKLISSIVQLEGKDTMSVC